MLSLTWPDCSSHLAGAEFVLHLSRLVEFPDITSEFVAIALSNNSILLLASQGLIGNQNDRLLTAVLGRAAVSHNYDGKDCVGNVAEAATSSPSLEEQGVLIAEEFVITDGVISVGLVVLGAYKEIGEVILYEKRERALCFLISFECE